MILQVLLLGAVMAPLASGGVCPSYPIIRDFDFRLYTGVWYQQDKQQESWGTPGRCWRTLYVRDSVTGHYKMRLLYQNTITGGRGTFESQLTLQGAPRASVIKYSIPYSFFEESFQVLATDYSSYSVEYQCSPNSILPKTENVFLMTREKTPSALVLQKAYAIMHRYGIDLRKLERVDQTCGGVNLKGVMKPSELIFTPLVIPADDPLFTDTGIRIQPTGTHVTGNYLETVDGGVDYDENVRRWWTEEDPFDQLTAAGSDSHAVSSYHLQPSDYTQFAAQYTHAPKRKKETKYRNPNSRKRMALGQSLVTRLWHVLHTPLM